MRIGIDIDDTITNTQDKIDEIALEKENKQIYDRTKHWFYERFNTSADEDTLFFYKYAREIMGSADIKENASLYINKLHDLGHEIYIITARSNKFADNIMDITLDYLAKNEIKYDKIIFQSHNKADICRENNIDVMVDDSIEHIEEITNVGIKVIIMDNEYNRNSNGTRAKNWEEVYNLIESR